MPSHTTQQLQTDPHTGKQYYLITNVVTTVAKTDAEIDLNAESWKLPYSIDDSDLTFDGKPLNLLYEENRWMAEHDRHVDDDGSHHHEKQHKSSSSNNKEKSHKSSRGRSRQKK